MMEELNNIENSKKEEKKTNKSKTSTKAKKTTEVDKKGSGRKKSSTLDAKKKTGTTKKTVEKKVTTKKTTSKKTKKVINDKLDEETINYSGKGKTLVIVESPAKSKTIKKILGNNYQIEASYGHIRDFPPKILGFDVENNFVPTFEIIPEKQHIVNKLNTMAKRSDKVFLASDPDREGEAIAWHVREVLDIPDEKVCRIAFNEITPKAVKQAVENSRNIDMNKVKAQQTRQILDRLVGYKISPVLWEKMKNNRLSAGRVQSVALKMICQREDEINSFTPEEYWTIGADFQKDNQNFFAELTKVKNKKIEIKNEKEAYDIVKILSEKNIQYKVDSVTEKESKRKPQAPFITSTLQREASNRLGYGVARTMQIAQKLYEGIEIEGEPVGLITYMRTDSFRISDDATSSAKEFIINNFGEKYYPEKANIYSKSKKNTQDAHEAIRPTYIDKTPDSLKSILSSEQYRLYKLIWDRFISSQMGNAVISNKTIEIKGLDYIFKVGTSKIIFDGFLKVYGLNYDDNENIETKLPELNKDDIVNLEKLIPKQHFTQPPPRYSEASLVKALEEYGIGRPSTYAPIITKIQQKGYVEKPEKSLIPTMLGKTVSTQLNEHFKDIINYEFTASMESKLDEIAEEKKVWNTVLEEFYSPFIETVDNARKNMGNVIITSDKICPNCNSPMVVKTSRFGTQFLGCSNYPECKTMMPLNADVNSSKPELTDEKCEKCNSDMIIKFGPFGKYLQCTNDKCKHRKAVLKTIGVKCPKAGCDGEIVERKSRRGRIFYGCNKYPNCDFVSWNEPVNAFCPKCNSILVKHITKKFNRLKCSNKECDYIKEIEDTELND